MRTAALYFFLSCNAKRISLITWTAFSSAGWADSIAGQKLSHLCVCLFVNQGPDFREISWRTYEKLMKKSDFKKLRWACDYQKNLIKKLRMKLCKTYEKLTTTLQVSYENVNFAASDVIRETLCRRPLLVEYFELKITDNQSDDFLRMLSKNDVPFSGENLSKSHLADLQKTYENLTTNLGKILQSFENRAPGWHES